MFIPSIMAALSVSFSETASETAAEEVSVLLSPEAQPASINEQSINILIISDSFINSFFEENGRPFSAASIPILYTVFQRMSIAGDVFSVGYFFAGQSKILN